MVEHMITLPLTMLTNTEVRRFHKRMLDRLLREVPHNGMTITAVNLLRAEMKSRGLS